MVQKVLREDQFSELEALLRNIGRSNVFLVRGDRSYNISGAESFIDQLLGNTEVDSFHHFEPNPQLHDLANGIARFKKGNYKLIMAIGGGSVLDMAKLISVFAHQQAGIEAIVKGDAPTESTKTPLLAIPTTAGTGAEATKFAVLYIDKKKYSFEHPLVLPDHVFLSPRFLHSSTPYLTACAGLDAFSQAVESVWSVNATDASESIALNAISMIWNHLHHAVNQGDPDSRGLMLEAAHLSGKAINITRTTAPHALSYAFTSYYNIPHGHAVALTLPFFLEFNYAVTGDDCTDPRGPGSVRTRIDKILGILNTGIDHARVQLEEFISSIGVSLDITSLTGSFDPEIIAENVNTQRLTNNPRVVSKHDILKMLQNQ